jgi:secondary thiamine-phosphate synthase enzyme
MLTHVNVKTTKRNEFINITGLIEKELKDSGVQRGVCHVFVPHTTAGVTINEGADPSVQKDVLATLARLIPHEGRYLHAEGNSDAHVKSSVVGVSVSVPVEGGRLMLGTWQAIFFCEFDGPRHRRVTVSFMGD